MKLHKSLLPIIGFALSVAMLSGCAEKDSTGWDRIEKNKEIIVGTSGTLYPTSFHNEADNALTGFEVEIVKEAADRLGLKVSFKEMPFDGMLPSLNSGQIDIAVEDINVTEERKEKFAFSTPYKYSYGTMIVRADGSSGIETLEDLNGKTVGGAGTSTFNTIAENYGAEVKVYEGGSELILGDVANGRIDAILNDYLLQKMAIAYYNDPKIKLHETIKYAPNETAIIMNKDNEELKNKLDAVIKEMLEDGTIEKLALDFYGEDVTKPVDIE